MKVEIDLDGLRNLLPLSKSEGTTDKWAEIALEWMEEANEEILKLRKEVKDDN